MKNKISKSEIINFIIVFCLILYKYSLMWLSNTDIKINSVVLLIVLFALVFILAKNYNKVNIKKILLIILFFLLVYYKSQTIDVFIALLFALLVFKEKNGDKKIVKYFVVSSAVLFTCTIILSFLGILPNIESQRIVDGYIVFRNSLGFEHVNAPFLYFIPIILGIIYIKEDKLNKWVFLLIVNLISLVLYHYTQCRTGLFIIIILNLLLISEKFIVKTRVFLFIIKYNYIIFLILSFFLAMYFGINFNNQVNIALSYRPYLFYQALSTYGIHLFGYGVNANIILDSTYFTYLLSYGLVPYLFYLFFYIKQFKSFSPSSKKIIVLSIFAIYGIIENNFVFCNNFILALQFLYFLSEDKKERKEVSTNE